MKLLCSVGWKKQGQWSRPKKKKPSPLFLGFKKKKRIEQHFKHHNQRGIFLFSCPHVFMCAVLLYRNLISCKCSTNRASIHRTESRQNPEEFVKRVSHHAIRCNWRYLHCSILLQISIYIQENEWLYVWICVLVLKKQHAARFFYRIWIHLISLRWQWTSSTLKNSWHPCFRRLNQQF